MKIGDKVKLKDGVNAPDPDCMFGMSDFTFFSQPDNVMVVVSRPNENHVDLQDTVTMEEQSVPRAHIIVID